MRQTDGTWAKDSNDHYRENAATAKCFQIVNADLEGAVNFAFCINSFNEVKQWGKKDDKKPINAVGLLEKYYIAVKANDNIDYGNNEDEKKLIDNIYQLALQVAQLVDENPTDQASYEKWLDRFETILPKKDFIEVGKAGDDEEGHKMLFGYYWGVELLKLKKTKKPTQTPSPTGKKPDDTKIDAARDEVLGTATGDQDIKNALKKLFDDNRAELKKQDEAVLTNLKELAKIIDRAYKNGAEVRKSELEVYSKSTDANQKKAWELANKVVDKNKKKLGEEALNKATKKEKTLDEIKQEAKGKMGDDKAWAAIIKNNSTLNTKALVNKVVEIFGKCKSAWGKNKGTDDNLVSELEGYQSSNATEWGEINKYEFDDKGNASAAGYASGALAKLKKVSADLAALITQSKIAEVKDQAGLDKAMGIIRGSPDYNSVKTDVEQLIEPRGKLLVELNKDNNADKKALAQLVAEFIKKFEKNYADNDYAANLSTLESKLTELRKYGEKGDKNAVYNSLSSDGKATLNKLISGLDAKVKAMQEAKRASEQSNTQSPPEGGWKTWHTIALIAVLVLVAGAVAYYFLRSNSNEETDFSLQKK